MTEVSRSSRTEWDNVDVTGSREGREVNLV